MGATPRGRGRAAAATLVTGLLASLTPSTSAGSVGMGCVRNPAGRGGWGGAGGGVFERCSAAAAVAPGTPASYAFTITPADVADQKFDIELAVGVTAGDVDFHIDLPADAPPSSTRPTLRASTPGVPAALYLPRTALVPGRYRMVLSPPPDSDATAPCVGADAEASIAFVMAPRRASPETTAAVKQFISTCCPAGSGAACEAVLRDDLAGEDADICAAPWAVCTRSGALQDLRLPRAGLACDAATALAPLLAAAGAVLRALDLGGNALTGDVSALATTLAAGAPALASLDVRANALAGDLGAACGLATPPALAALDLSGNAGISGSLPGCLVSSPPALRTLRLDGTGLGGGADLPPLAPTLQRLSAPRAGLSGDLPAAFPPHLVALDLAGNRLGGSLPPSPPDSLCALRLDDNALAGPIPPAYGEAPALVSVSLAGNALGGVMPSGWAYRPRLRHVDVSRNGAGLNGSLHTDWAGATALRSLNASHNGLWGPLPPSLVAAPSLSVLDLRGNVLTGGLPEAAAALPRDGSSLLRTLDLSANPGLDVSALPACGGLARLGTFQADGVVERKRKAALSRAAAAVAGGGGTGQRPPPLERTAALDRRPPPSVAARRAAIVAAAAAAERAGAVAAAEAAPRRLALGGAAAGGADFPAWLVDALMAGPASQPPPPVDLAGLGLACPAGGIEVGSAAWALPHRGEEAAPFVVRTPPATALAGLTCAGPGGGEVPVAAVVRDPPPPAPPSVPPPQLPPTPPLLIPARDALVSVAATGAAAVSAAADAARGRAAVVGAASLALASAAVVGVAAAVSARASAAARRDGGRARASSGDEPGEYCPEAGVVAALRVERPGSAGADALSPKLHRLGDGPRSRGGGGGGGGGRG